MIGESMLPPAQAFHKLVNL